MARYTQTAKTTVSPAMIPNMMARIGPTSRIAIARSQLSTAALLFQSTIGFSLLLAARAVLAL